LRKRRSSDSAAQRYWVGFSPILEKARRHACISGSSPSGRSASRDLAVAMNVPVREPTGTSWVIPSTYKALGTSWGKSRQISPEC
jgi:hypothetical protein